jgi:D-tyrosyl-tRNA(Tyr) deacylase
MRVVIQRVQEASVRVDAALVGQIKQGLLVLLGVEEADTEEDIAWLTNKIMQLRIFSDEAGQMNKSLLDIAGDLMVVSQFTLFAATKKGNRPSFIRAARPESAIPLYDLFLQHCEKLLGKPVQKGIFGADMQISLINDGPVTICIDSKLKE